MKFRGIFVNDQRKVVRRIGFNSQNVVFFSSTDDPDVTAVTLAVNGVKELLWIECTEYDFYLEKMRANEQDKLILIKN